MIDNRDKRCALTNEQVAKLCDRRFGIGADGLILLQLIDGYDFEMVYYNSDGNESTMCGNGGRCIVQFAHDLNIIQGETNFKAIDGPHRAFVLEGEVKLQMIDVKEYKQDATHCEINTGSPHYVLIEKEIDAIDIVPRSRAIRYSDAFPKGINVNYVEQINADSIKVRTYERGVEDETYSCGTGVCAAAMAFALQTKSPFNQFNIQTKGGNLVVSFIQSTNGFSEVFLKGKAERVFEGEVDK